jgi:hypothetical protein
MPLNGLDFELNQGVDVQVGSVRACLVQNRLGDFNTELKLELIHTQMDQKLMPRPVSRECSSSMPTYLNRPQHSLQNRYDQQHDPRQSAANGGRAQGFSCSAFLYPKRPELYPPSSGANFIVHSNERPEILFSLPPESPGNWLVCCSWELATQDILTLRAETNRLTALPAPGFAP